jgi:hypothetical protein
VGLDWPTSIAKLSCWLLWPWESPREMLALKIQTAVDALHVDFKKVLRHFELDASRIIRIAEHRGQLLSIQPPTLPSPSPHLLLLLLLLIRLLLSPCAVFPLPPVCRHITIHNRLSVAFSVVRSLGGQQACSHLLETSQTTASGRVSHFYYCFSAKFTLRKGSCASSVIYIRWTSLSLPPSLSLLLCFPHHHGSFGWCYVRVAFITAFFRCILKPKTS